MTADAIRAIDDAIEECRVRPLDLLSLGDGEGEHRYNLASRPSYVRTVLDVVRHTRASGKLDPAQVRIVEVGAFLGVVSCALARLGYRVTATDIPEFMANDRLRARLDGAGIAHFAANLRDHRLPLEDASVDVVLMCETLEHLNFNPLPVVVEVNRVLVPGGLFYVALPNIARWDNRLRLLTGRSIHNPITDFFAQLDPSDNMIVGLHWREYTTGEVKEMLERLGFAVVEQRLFSDADVDLGPTRRSVRQRIKRKVLDAFPSLKSNQVALAVKQSAPKTAFRVLDATR